MYKIKQEVYPINFYFCNDRKDYCKSTQTELNDRVMGRCYYAYGSGIETKIIIAVFNNEIGTLIHELQHANIFLGEYIGMRLNEETSEAFCYFIDNILYKQCILLNKKYKGKNFKII